ncbi:FkbM family methyltransferase [Azospirillum sp.]|uniref:FkbM family methyltransferase n=1 Tax=Azospirillum sp. TaxID=34012 RepID=UPI003D74244E
MLPHVDVVETEIGRYLLFAGDDLISAVLRAYGNWDPVTVATAEMLLDMDGRGGTIIDGGANLGAFSIPIAKLAGGRYQVLSFEVQRIVYYQLCGNVVLNGVDTVYPFNFGLSDREGHIRIPKPDYTTDGNIGALSIDPAVRAVRRQAGIGAPTDAPQAETQLAELITLDSLDLTDVRLIKLDVEGVELSVLRGADRTLRDCGYPPILFEIWDMNKLPGLRAAQEELFAHVGALGYAITVLGDLALAQHRRTQPVHLGFAFDANGALGVTRTPAPEL